MREALLAVVLLLGSFPFRSHAIENVAMTQASCLPYRSPGLAKAAQVLCDGKLVNAFANLANQTFSLTKPLGVVAKECGQSNAFYDRNQGAVIICYEIAKEIFDRAVREVKMDANGQGSIAAGALSFVFFHELGHAVINQYSLPVLGREEDAADQIGTFMLIGMAANNAEVARYWTVGAAWYFSKREWFFSRSHFSDEHSVNPQRKFNVACWIYGSDTSKYAGLVRYAKLPASRAQQCPGEFQQMANAAKQMLAPYVKRPGSPEPSGSAQAPGASGGFQASGGTMAERAMACNNEARSRNLGEYEKKEFMSDCYKNNGIVVRSAQ